LPIAFLAAQSGNGLAAAEEKKGPPPGMPVKVAQVRTDAVSHDITAVGSLIANESVVIRPEVAGRVAAIHFSEGQAVAAGARLLTLDQAELQAQVAGSSADERLTAQRAERAGELFKKNFISQQALDDAREAHKKASARKTEDLARLAKSDIRAPFAGALGLRNVSVGAYVKAGDDIVRLDSIAAMKMDFRVPETYLGKINKEQVVSLKVDAWPAETFKGKVYALETAVDEKTRTVLLRARVDNPGLRLKPGMFARISLTLGSKADALLIPEQAVVPRGKATLVFKVEEGKAKPVPVRLGSRIKGEVEVLEGLKAGDTVVTEGHQKLGPGTPVMPMGDKPAAEKKG
jgi:membrane fusion protein (multidrug efflux system)